MAIYTVKNNDGVPVVFYDSTIHEDIPNNAVEISNETHEAIFANYGNVALDENNLPIPYTKTHSIEELKRIKLREINNAFINSISSGTIVSITISGNATEILMDASDQAANKMKSGYDLAVLNNETEMHIVDFNNGIHYDVPIDQCLEIARQQGNYYREQWGKRAVLRTNISNATTKEQIDLIVW